MSVYDKVQHLMVPMRPVSPEQLAWIDTIADTCSDFCEAIGMDEADGIRQVSLTLQTAGEVLWETCDGKPSWSRLDVDDYVSRVKGNLFGHRDMPQIMVHILTIFNMWLGDTKQVPRGKAIKKVRQLLRHCDIDGQGTGSAAAQAHAVN